MIVHDTDWQDPPKPKTIYLIGDSHYQEDLLLDKFATDEAGVRALVLRDFERRCTALKAMRIDVDLPGGEATITTNLGGTIRYTIWEVEQL